MKEKPHSKTPLPKTLLDQPEQGGPEEGLL